MNRIDLKIITQISIEMDRYDIEIGSAFANNTFKRVGSLETFLTLRFGYWKELDGMERIAVDNILDACNAKLMIDREDYDDDCGWLYSYRIIEK